MLDVFIYNSLQGKKEKFVPITPNYLGMYACGPTLYQEVHLGNLRTFITFDVVYRLFLSLGYKVRYVRNITDVGHLENDADEGEDKIAKQARLEQIEPMEIVQKYANSFKEIQRIFNMMPPSIEPLATGHIPEQIEMIQRILANDLAYVKNGSVYLNVRKYNNAEPYGELSGRKIDELLHETRDLDGTEEKNDPLDFCLWKKASPEHIMQWNSPWGLGFPGWHIECSAMSQKYLGKTFDIHGGGMDLKFPHHEAEIAQSKSDCGCQPVNYWMHSNMLTANGVKMSKSKGNSFLPMQLINGESELLSKGFHAMVVRFFMMQTHYRSTLDFSNEALLASEKGYHRLMNTMALISQLNVGEKATNLDNELIQLCNEATEQICDDFNTAMSLASLFEICNKVNALYNGQSEYGSIVEKTKQKLLDTFKHLVIDVMGILPINDNQNQAIDKVMQLVLELRKQVRANKDFAMSDKIRDELKSASIQIKDSKEGSNWEWII